MMRFRVIVTAYAVISAFAWLPISGMFYASNDFTWPCQKWAEDRHRKRLGADVVVGFFYAMVWPFGIPASYAITGFAERGIRFTPVPRSERYATKECPWESVK